MMNSLDFLITNLYYIKNNKTVYTQTFTIVIKTKTPLYMNKFHFYNRNCMSHPKTWRSNTEMDRASDYLFKPCVGFIILHNHTYIQFMLCICY